MSILQTFFLILTSATGIGAAWVLRKKTHSEFLSILLSFSGAYLLGAVVLHLLPEIFTTDQPAAGNVHAHDYTVAIFVLAGFFIQLIIVQFTRGIEHGHLHLHEHLSKGYVTGVIFGLSIHAFMEGIPLSANTIEPGQLAPLFRGILLHKIPESFALATVLFFSIKNSTYAFIILALFALMTPIGSVTGKYFAENGTFPFNWLLAVVCGSLIHISTTIIFEASGKAHKIGLYKFLAIIAGSGIALLSLLFE